MDKSQGQGKKRNKSYYRKCGKNYSKQDRVLQVGMKGILITCSGMEAKCVRESYNLLNEYADKLYGPDRPTQETDQNDDVDSDEDIAESLQKEVNELKQQHQNKSKRFKSVRTGAKNVLFIQTKGIDQHEVVYSLLRDVEKTKTHKSRQIQRMLPVSHTCKPLEERIESTAKDMLHPYFHAPEAKDSTFCVMIKARNNNSVQKDAIIRVLAALVMQNSPHQHKVDFDDPDYTVMVDIIGGVCCLSVLRSYSRFRKYNLYLIAKGSDSDEDGKRKRKDLNILDGEKVELDQDGSEVKRLKVAGPVDNDVTTRSQSSSPPTLSPVPEPQSSSHASQPSQECFPSSDASSASLSSPIDLSNELDPSSSPDKPTGSAQNPEVGENNLCVQDEDQDYFSINTSERAEALNS